MFPKMSTEVPCDNLLQAGLSANSRSVMFDGGRCLIDQLNILSVIEAANNFL